MKGNCASIPHDNLLDEFPWAGPVVNAQDHKIREQEEAKMAIESRSCDHRLWRQTVQANKAALPRAGYCLPPSLSPPICKMGLLIASTLQGCFEDSKSQYVQGQQACAAVITPVVTITITAAGTPGDAGIWGPGTDSALGPQKMVPPNVPVICG